MFGGNAGIVWPPEKEIKQGSVVTAIAIVYSKYGFVIAADGRSRWGEDEAADETTRARETDKQQKIFEAIGRERIFGYALTGAISNREGSFNLIDIALKQCAVLAPKTFSGAQSYVLEFAQELKMALAAARKDGRLEQYPTSIDTEAGDAKGNFLIAKIFFAGYFKGKPTQVTATLYHEVQKLREPKIDQTEFSPGGFVTNGADKIAELMFGKGDARFVKYKRPIHAAISLQGAGLFAKGFIEACCDPCAAEIQPLCKGIGGHIHIAEVTPRAFRWRVPPISA